jgi:hypothetical protein
MEIGFFEFLSYTDMMEDAGIAHFKSCVSLTYLHKDLLFENDEAKSAIEQLRAHLPDTVMALVYGHPGRKSTESSIEADEIDTRTLERWRISQKEGRVGEGRGGEGGNKLGKPY